MSNKLFYESQTSLWNDLSLVMENSALASAGHNSSFSKNQSYALHKLEEINMNNRPKHLQALKNLERLSKSQLKSPFKPLMREDLIPVDRMNSHQFNMG